ncbi:MAG: rhodanese-like domain-containing protein [Thermaurantimonas sp.]|uniref:rhodanese-like domain-containing protein n=1 Tax=Thermaurantimonas TaxID=2681566 RepID=UPI0023F31798|nr:rhodanese-like domain-containing protein [Thermaurantimonas aggregans]MCX8147653.1 rhodanese-like domain-containing protein [Thermaurantimonas aggregans]
MTETINLKEIINQEGTLLVDVRSPNEFMEGSARNAINIPVDQIPYHLSEFQNRENIVVFCRSGNRSEMAKQMLTSYGIKNVYNAGTWQDVLRNQY